MSQESFQVFQNGVSYLEILCHGICLAWFLGKTYFHADTRNLGRIAAFLAYTGFYAVRFWLWDIPGWISCIAVFCVLAVVLRKRQRAGQKMLVFLLVTWYCVQNICILIESSLYNMVSNVLVRHFQDADTFLLQLAVVYFLGSMLRVALVTFMMFMLAKKAGKCLDHLSGKEVVSLLLMPVAGVLFGNIIVKVMFVVQEETYFSLYEEFPFFQIIVPIVGVLFYMGILFSVSAYNSMLELQEEKKKNFVQEQKVQAMKNRMEEMTQIFDASRRMKHDMKNHVTTVKGLIARGALEEADAYISQMSVGMGVFEFGIQTGNPVTDVIINDYSKKARMKGIDFSAAFHIDETSGIEAFDMGIVVGNLLENALEACALQPQEKKWIQITGRKKSRFYFLQVKNTFAGTLVFDEKTGLPVSTKKIEEGLHGLGLGNVAEVVEKYLGSMEVTAEKGIFCVKLLLQEKAGADD